MQQDSPALWVPTGPGTIYCRITGRASLAVPTPGHPQPCESESAGQVALLKVAQSAFNRPSVWSSRLCSSGPPPTGSQGLHPGCFLPPGARQPCPGAHLPGSRPWEPAACKRPRLFASLPRSRYYRGPDLVIIFASHLKSWRQPLSLISLKVKGARSPLLQAGRSLPSPRRTIDCGTFIEG